MEEIVFAANTVNYLRAHGAELNAERLSSAVQYLSGEKQTSACESEAEAHLSSLVCTLYQHRVRASDLGSVLQSHTLPASLTSLLLQHWDSITSALDQSSGPLQAKIFIPQLCDVSWSTSYVLSSGRLRHVLEPVCATKLKITNAEGEVEEVSFEMSKEQLSTVLYKMKVANAQIEKMIG